MSEKDTQWNPGIEGLNEVDFYEKEFYPLSNFSSFQIEWDGLVYPTSEHVYHSEKFFAKDHKEQIRNARSAHDAFKLARELKQYVRDDWGDVKLAVMKAILLEKIDQHPYVKKKLLETSDVRLVEGSWRDGYWGCGPDGNGDNWLGRLWMEVRSELRSQP